MGYETVKPVKRPRDFETSFLDRFIPAFHRNDVQHLLIHPATAQILLQSFDTHAVRCDSEGEKLFGVDLFRSDGVVENAVLLCDRRGAVVERVNI